MIILNRNSRSYQRSFTQVAMASTCLKIRCSNKNLVSQWGWGKVGQKKLHKWFARITTIFFRSKPSILLLWLLLGLQWFSYPKSTSQASKALYNKHVCQHCIHEERKLREGKKETSPQTTSKLVKNWRTESLKSHSTAFHLALLSGFFTVLEAIQVWGHYNKNWSKVSFSSSCSLPNSF